MFLAPLFLLGLLAAAIPVVLHLRRSTQTKRIVFSTNRFFDSDFIRSSRRARLQDRLLMLLRAALLALFALALAQPLVKLPTLARVTGAVRNVAIIIDDSASMSLTGANGTLLDEARQSALALVDELSAERGDRVTVLLAGRRDAGPTVLFDEPTSDLAAVRDAIEHVSATDLATDAQAAVRTAAMQLGGDASTGVTPSGSREVYVFSDQQRTAYYETWDLDPQPGLGVFFVAVRGNAALARANVSVDAVQYGAARPVVGVPFTIRSLVTNHADAPRQASLALTIDGETISERIEDLPAGRGRVVRWTHRFTEPGWHHGTVRYASGDDALAADNDRHFAVHVQDAAHIVAVNGAASSVKRNDELFFFRLALGVQSGDAAAAARTTVHINEWQPDTITAERLDGVPLVVLANVASLSDAALADLERYVDGGGSLIITLGDRVTAEVYNGWLGDNRLHGGLLPGRLLGIVGDPAAEADAQPAGFIAQTATEHPMLAGFDEAALGSLNRIAFKARFQIDAPDDAVLMRASTGDAVLAEKRFGKGRVLLWASSIDRDWTNLPLQPTFVPLLYRMVGHMAQSGITPAGFVRTGQLVVLPRSTTQQESPLIETPQGRYIYPQRMQISSDAAADLVIESLDHTGVYAVRDASDDDHAPPRHLLAVNIPDDEAAAAVMDKAAFAALLPEGFAWDYADRSEDVALLSQRARQGFGLWNQLLILALLVGLFEPWLANRLSRRRRRAQDAMRQRDVAGRTTPTPAPPAGQEAA